MDGELIHMSGMWVAVRIDGSIALERNHRNIGGRRSHFGHRILHMARRKTEGGEKGCTSEGYLPKEGTAVQP